MPPSLRTKSSSSQNHIMHSNSMKQTMVKIDKHQNEKINKNNDLSTNNNTIKRGSLLQNNMTRFLKHIF